MTPSPIADHPPSGIVAFLFTDVEGSTRLWERDRAAMRAAAARHDAILAAAVARHGGALFKHVGDAVQAAFPTASGAVAAAVAAQRTLAAEPWPETGPLRVRMALHLGEAAPNAAGDYNQVPCLNRLSRLLSTGFGGQVLLSDAVRGQVAGDLPPGVTLRDLGRHRLRDLLAPERVSQLVVAGLPDAFPPLKSLEGVPHNLPRQPTALIGREAELAAIEALLTGGDRRLVTLTGPGGAGKTRLALQAAADLLDRFEDGAWLVELGRIEDPARVPPAIAETLGLREGGGPDPLRALAAHLGEQRALLLLDNLEQVAGCGPQVADLLAACPNLRLLATSRVPLRVAAEQLYEVPPLALPPEKPRAADELGENPAVRLFVERAAAKLPGFALDAANAKAIATICRRLDGLPLALELAAAQIRHHTPDELLAQLDRRFDLLTGGDPSLLSHQQALATTIAWSHDRLPAPEQALLRRLAVFAGGWTREAAEWVMDGGLWVAGDGLQDTRDDPQPKTHNPSPITLVSALVDASIVRRSVREDGTSRWTMLESIRTFGLARLEAAGETAAIRDRLAAWCLKLAEEADPKLDGPEQERWLHRLAAEHDNLRAALAWTESTAQGEDRLRLPAALWRFWRTRGFLTEGRGWLERALAEEFEASELHVQALNGAGVLAQAQGDYPRAQHWFERGLVAARSLGDRGREAALLNNLGVVALARGDLLDAEDLFKRSLAVSEASGAKRWRADALANLGALAHYRGDVQLAMSRYVESLQLCRERGDQRGVAQMLLNLLLLLAPLPEQRERARLYGEEGLRLCRALGNRQDEGMALAGLGMVAEAEGDLVMAANLHEQSLEIFREVEDWSGVGRALGNLGLVYLDLGDTTRATGRLRDALRRNMEMGEQDGTAAALEGLAAVAAPDAPERGARLFGAADRLREEVGAPVPMEFRRRHETTVSVLRNRLGKAFTAAWAQGRALTIEEATTEALSSNPLPKPAAVGAEAKPDDLLAGIDDLVVELRRVESS